ncbi:MAG: hypothetical protein H6882_05135 [Rhodobiaceae bacterium]|nr:hypothetical protein [Rhodobiaceae bacterium]
MKMGPGGVRRFAFPDAGGFMITEETKDTGAPGDAGDSLAALWRALKHQAGRFEKRVASGDAAGGGETAPDAATAKKDAHGGSSSSSSFRSAYGSRR